MTVPGPHQTRVNCLPTYIMIDTSYSMKDDEDTLNETIEYLYDELITSPRICEFAHVSLIAFNTDAHVVLEMTDIESIDHLPRLECNGVTNFTRAFQVLRERIDLDVSRLNTAGREVLRPVAFVLTDGQPTDHEGHLSDDWKAEYARLTDPSWRRHPNVVPFGFGKATASVLQQMATIDDFAFLARNSAGSDALKRIFATLLHTLVASAQHNELQLPTSVDGFIRVSQDIIG
jgi:uncharacterized protein YegL